MNTDTFTTAEEYVAYWQAQQRSFPVRRWLADGPRTAADDDGREKVVAYETTHVGERLWCVTRWERSRLRDVAFLEAGLDEALVSRLGNSLEQQVIQLAITDGHWRDATLPAEWRNPMTGRVIEPRCRVCLKTFATHDRRGPGDIRCDSFQPDPRNSLPVPPMLQRYHGNDTTFAYYDVREADAYMGQLFEYWIRRGDLPIPYGVIAKTLAFCLLLLTATLSAQTPGVYKRAYDNANSGWNPNETILTQAGIRTRGLRRITTIPVIGDSRGMEAQPLIAPALKMADGSTHDVLVLPSMANVVRGVDAETGAGLWQVTLGTPVTSNGTIDFHQINQHWGCLSTGVIDPDTNYLYQSCWISIDGSGNPASGRYFLFVLDLRSGAQVYPPANLQGSDQSEWKQRSSLLLTNINGVKTVFLAHGSVNEVATGYTGGITAFDVASNTVSAYLPMTSGIWMAGASLSADAQGVLYGLTGNGDFDPSKGWYGESFIKVRYTPAATAAAHPTIRRMLTTPASLQVIYPWSPWTDYARAGQRPPSGTKLAGESSPSEAARPVGGGMSMSMAGAKVTASMNTQGQAVALVYPMATGAWSDEDWGSAGPACLFALHVCVAAGKDGIGYPISTTDLGGTTTATVGTAANYARLAAPCAWLTMNPGPVPCAPANPQTLNFFPWGVTAHLHMTPVQFYDPVLKSWTIFVWGENSQLHKWAVGPKGDLSYVAQSREYASADVRGDSPGGMPGGFLSGSSNQNDPVTALLFSSVPYGDANATMTQGRLLIYDPVHLAPDGSLAVLWDSQAWGVAYVYNKFMPPTVWNGHVYLPNYNGGVDVYGY